MLFVLLVGFSLVSFNGCSSGGVVAAVADATGHVYDHGDRYALRFVPFHDGHTGRPVTMVMNVGAGANVWSAVIVVAAVVTRRGC